MMTHLDLFSGVGGFSLAARMAGGIETVGFCEIDPFCRAVLAKHWPGVWQHDDIRTLDESAVRAHCPRIDIITGGFPCQDISDAGRRIGIEGSRSSLWWEMHRLIREVRPRFVIVENVSALLDRGMGDVLGGLAQIGYDAEWSVLSACAVGAPHVRERVFIVAYPQSGRQRQCGRLKRAEEGNEKWDIPWTQDEPPVARMADGVSDRSHRLIALGNAIVPQVAANIFRAILAVEPQR